MRAPQSTGDSPPHSRPARPSRRCRPPRRAACATGHAQRRALRACCLPALGAHARALPSLHSPTCRLTRSAQAPPPCTPAPAAGAPERGWTWSCPCRGAPGGGSWRGRRQGSARERGAPGCLLLAAPHSALLPQLTATRRPQPLRLPPRATTATCWAPSHSTRVATTIHQLEPFPSLHPPAAGACLPAPLPPLPGLSAPLSPPTARMRLGMLPSSAITRSRATASSLPTTSRMLDGRYFSTCGCGAAHAGAGRTRAPPMPEAEHAAHAAPPMRRHVQAATAPRACHRRRIARELWPRTQGRS
jgi:hypothetical protein